MANIPIPLIVAVGLGILLIGYVSYGSFAVWLFGVDPNRKTPAQKLYDGKDFVPARNWLVLFGHHFASIAGAGPIVGPTLALMYWGWLPALLWILLGSVFLGGVHDLGSLVVSLRNDAKSISENSRKYISERARIVFSIFVWFALVLIVAVFAHYAANSYVKDPHIVWPSLGLIPVALIFGFMTYRLGLNMVLSTLTAVLLMLLLIPLGEVIPIKASYAIWMVVLFVYAYIASLMPVQYLLQPRDYLSAYLLIGGMVLMLIGALISGRTMHLPPLLKESPAPFPFVPFLFVTIACGAISGFHSLIASGTTAKQLPSERYAKRIGYGGMLMEGALALLVVVAVGSLTSGLDLKNPIGTFGRGVSNITPFLGDYGGYFAILVLNAFILTTLDTATRIARYVTEELFKVRNMYLSSAIVVGVAILIILGGQAGKLWTVFGAANQLLAALALLVITGFLMSLSRNPLLTLLPGLFMLVITLSALAYQIKVFLTSSSPNYVAVIFAVALFLLGLYVGFEALWRWLVKGSHKKSKI
ncbi:MAG: carbon starvation protein A [Thermotogae bacterium]|nr:carbon starvation protein A [Thermotogota bacterium]